MPRQRNGVSIALLAAAAGLTSLAQGVVHAQMSPTPPTGATSPSGATAPQSRSTPTTAPSAGRGLESGSASPAGATAPQSRSTPTTAPSAGRGLEAGNATNRNPTTPRGDALGGPTGGNAVTGGVPALGGVTPNRAELPASAFGKLDAANRGYVTLDDVRQLSGFETAFRQADQNGDGRLNLSEFNTAWGIYTGNVR